MPIFASNFTSNSLSGAVFVSGGNVAVTLTPTAYALEGDKSFVIKIRKGSAQGTVVSTSAPITLKDRSSFVSLTANTATVLEGNLVSFTVVTANVLDGATLYYSVFPATANVTADDFTANTGSIVITNNTATFALKANTDLSLMDETGENFKVQLRTNSTTGNVVYVTSNVAITDFSKGYGYISFTSPSATWFEGDTIRFQVQTYNAANAVLYYSTTGGNAATSNFIANTGSFTVGADNFANITLVANTNLDVNDTRTFQLQIRIGAVDGVIATTSNVITIKDLGLKPPDIELLLVAGGGGGGNGGNWAAGGGAGGLLYYGANTTPKTPNGNLISTTSLLTYTVTVGAGGAVNTNGGNTFIRDPANVILGGTAVGGGSGGAGAWSPVLAGNGGSGGGGSQASAPGSVITGAFPGGTGISGQGYAGGAGYSPGPSGGVGTGGGGGAGGVGTNGGNQVAGNGGAGIGYNLVGSVTFYAGGGAGQSYAPGGSYIGSGGVGGGGGNSTGGENTGGGGGINIAGSGLGLAGGPGIAIIRYSDTKANATTTGSPNLIISGGFKTYRFWQSGSITFP